MSIITKSAALLLCGFAGTMAAGAATPDSAPRVAVKYDAQALMTDSGVGQLYARIQMAAKQVCPDASVRDLAAQQQVSACRRQAIARAISQVDDSRLAALNAGRTKNG